MPLYRTGKKPEISVLLPVYNAETSIKAAIISILRQSFQDFELLVINDGSVDQSMDVIKSFSDPRIRVIDLGRNCGLIAALNRGLVEARGQFVARQDADDESLESRFSAQYAELRRDQQLVAIGTALQLMVAGRVSGESWRYPESAVFSRWQALFKTPVAHSAVIYRRKQVLDVGGYSKEFPNAEDYELWSRLVNVGNIRSLPQALVRYDVGEGGVSRARAIQQREMHCQIAQRNMAALLKREVPINLVDVVSIGSDWGESLQSISEFSAAVECCVSLYGAFLQKEGVEEGNTEVVADLGSRLRGLARMVPLRRRFKAIKKITAMAPKHCVSAREFVRLAMFP